MTLQQLQILTACASTKSFSTAAQRLFLSTSSVSKSMNALEQEIGYEIFARSPNGIQLTEKGAELVRHARILMQEYNDIVSLFVKENSVEFSCACPPLPYCSDSFATLCNRYQEEDSMNFLLFEGAFDQCLDRVSYHNTSVAIVIVPKTNHLYCTEEMNRRGLGYAWMKTLPYYIKMRKDHPLVQVYKKEHVLTQEMLEKYPMIDYRCNPDDYLQQLQTNLENNFYSKKVIHVNQMERKIHCLRHTNAFSLGLGLSANLAVEKDLFCVPQENNYANIYYVYNKKIGLGAIAQEFLELLQTELDSVQEQEEI